MIEARAAIRDESSLRRCFRRWLGPLLLVVLVAAAYGNSFAGAFLFDDVYHIVENDRIRRLWPITPLLLVERPVVEVSLALNFALGGLDPWGYHVFNVGVHLLSTLTLFGLARRTARRVQGEDRTASRGEIMAWWIAALWCVHPLCTQSVTYVIQRGESMMGLCYLLTVYCSVRAAESRRWGWWSAAAVLACALGMACKAVMVTAPVMVMMYDRVFLRSKGSLPDRRGSESRRVRRWMLYGGLLATWGILWACGIAGSVLDPDAAGVNVGFGYSKVSAFSYALTQTEVILRYLSLSFWPVGLCLDYDWRFVSDIREVILPGTMVVGSLVVTAVGLWRRRWWGFCGFWFFGVLAPSSSFVPIEDAMFEHRMYLSLAGVIAVVVTTVGWGVERLTRSTPAKARIPRTVQTAGVAVMVLLAYGTHHRNRAYASDLTMWTDVTTKRPQNTRAWVALGNAHLSRDQVDEAVASYQRSLQLQPDYADGHTALGMGLARRGSTTEAIACYREAIRLNGRHAKAYYNLGNALNREGNYAEAVEAFRESLAIRPSFADAHCNLGNALSRMGRWEEAIRAYHDAIHADPGHSKAHNNLGDALRQQGRTDQAVAAFLEAVTIDPSYANAHANLALAYLELRQHEAAVRHARRALELDANHATARDALERASRAARPRD